MNLSLDIRLFYETGSWFAGFKSLRHYSGSSGSKSPNEYQSLNYPDT